MALKTLLRPVCYLPRLSACKNFGKTNTLRYPASFFSSQSTSEADKFSEGAHDDISRAVKQNAQKNKEESIHQTLLTSSLKYVPQCGWSREALESGSKDCGVEKALIESLPHGGVVDLILHHREICTERIEHIIMDRKRERNAKSEEADTVVGKEGGYGLDTAFIGDMLVERLMMDQPLLSHFSHSLKLLLLHDSNFTSSERKSGNVTSKVVQLDLELMNIICSKAGGDVSTNSKWYANRLLTLGVYKSAQLVMLGDKSEEFTQTRDFVRRRLAFDISAKGGGPLNVNYDALTGLAANAPGDLRAVLTGMTHTAKALLGMPRN